MHSRALLVLTAALLLVVSPLLSAPPATGKRSASPAIPFDCFTSVWDTSFEILSTRYDKAGNRVIWELKAKKDGPVAEYEAHVVDPDGVEVDTIKVKLTPAVAKVKAGNKLQAVLPLGLTAGEPAKMTIRVRR